jgi:hypothetical protein
MGLFVNTEKMTGKETQTPAGQVGEYALLSFVRTQTDKSYFSLDLFYPID